MTPGRPRHFSAAAKTSSVIDLRRISSWTKRAIETLMRGERGTLEASTAKLFATEALGKVADCAVQIHGGMGYMREAIVESSFRDVRIMRIYEGSSEIQRNIIAGQLLKND